MNKRSWPTQQMEPKIYTPKLKECLKLFFNDHDDDDDSDIVSLDEPEPVKHKVKRRRVRKKDCKHGFDTQSKCKFCSPCDCYEWRLKSQCVICNYNDRFCQNHMKRYTQCGCKRVEKKVKI